MRHEVEVRDGIGSRDGPRIGGVFHVYCLSKDARNIRFVDGKLVFDGGELKWEDEFHNKTPNTELDHILQTEFTGGAQITTWYVGLTQGSPTPAAGDTMSSHAGWTEYTTYSQANRQNFTGVEASQAVGNSASPAVFTVNAGATTVGGAFLVSNNTIGGSTGQLACIGAFSGGNRSPANGDQIVVTYTFSAASTN